MKRILLIGLLALSLAGATCATTQGSSCKPTVHRACKKHPRPKPAPAKLVAQLSLGAPVFNLVNAFGSEWARVGADTVGGGDTIERVDPTTNAITAKITVAKGFGLAAGDGSLWAPNYGNETLTRIDPTTNAIMATIPIPNVGVDAIATTPGYVWVGTQGPLAEPGVVAKVSTATDAVVGTTTLPDQDGAFYAAATPSAIWLVSDQSLLRVDASSLQATALPGLISNQQPCGDIKADASSIWIAGGTCGFPRFSVEKIDPSTGGVLAQPQIPPVVDLALAPGMVWATSSAGLLLRLDRTKATITGSMKMGLGGSTAIDVADGAIWIADMKSGALERFAPR
jgi:streptogramin lyase